MEEAKTKVVNLRNEPFTTYIGRGSFWGNPYHIGRDGSREEVIEKYRRHLWQRIILDPTIIPKLIALRGETLGCYCAPLPCHGDVLIRAIEWAVKQQQQGE